MTSAWLVSEVLVPILCDLTEDSVVTYEKLVAPVRQYSHDVSENIVKCFVLFDTEKAQLSPTIQVGFSSQCTEDLIRKIELLVLNEVSDNPKFVQSSNEVVEGRYSREQNELSVRVHVALVELTRFLARKAAAIKLASSQSAGLEQGEQFHGHIALLAASRSAELIGTAMSLNFQSRYIEGAILLRSYVEEIFWIGRLLDVAGDWKKNSYAKAKDWGKGKQKELYGVYTELSGFTHLSQQYRKIIAGDKIEIGYGEYGILFNLLALSLVCDMTDITTQLASLEVRKRYRNFCREMRWQSVNLQMEQNPKTSSDLMELIKRYRNEDVRLLSGPA
jgi:hypothetical protein